MKAGFIAVVGRPNVGKSTLINKLVSEKVAIVSDKAGTTRDNIKGILNLNNNQYIFIDTPGIHKAKHLLGEYMTNSAIRVLKDVDVILFLLDGSQEISTGDQFVMERVMEAKKTPRILVINKIDKLSDEQLANIGSKLEARLERKVKLNCSVDETLLGGVVIRAGDLVIDNSARGRLNRLSDALQS